MGVTYRSMLSIAQPMQKVSLSATQVASVDSPGLRTNPPPWASSGSQPRTEASTQASWASGRSAAECSSVSASGEVRNSEMISTESTPAIRPSPSTAGA